MRVGFTYDLRDDYLKAGYSLEETAEFDSVNTIESIEGALLGLGHQVERIGNIKALATRLSEGKRWDLVFNITEGMHGIGREAQVPALLDAYAIPYTFSDTLVMALTLHKGLTKHIVRAHGLPTADFAGIAKPEEAERVDRPAADADQKEAGQGADVPSVTQQSAHEATYRGGAGEHDRPATREALEDVGHRRRIRSRGRSNRGKLDDRCPERAQRARAA